jgi:hypothetical protein
MRTAWLRALTPAGWVAVAGAAVLIAVSVAGGLGFRWDPFNHAERRREAAEARADRAEVEERTRTLEVEGGRELMRRREVQHQMRVQAVELTVAAVTLAEEAPDAEIPLDLARAARLRAHDDGLCGLGVLDCAGPAAHPSGGGDPPLPPADPAV